MIKLKKIFIALFIFTSLKVFAIQEIKTIKIESEALEENRKIMIRLPKNYATHTEKKFPVLVVLNEEDNFHFACDIVDIQSSRFGIEDMIVIGLPHNGNYEGDNFPYSDDANELNPQAQKYSSFIREEALIYVENNYRTNGGRFIIGHSLSGLFVINLFMQYPKSFSSYIVLSPSFHYTPNMAKEFKEFLLKHKELNNLLFLSIGENEHSLIQKGFIDLYKILEKNAPKTLDWKVSYLDNTDHLLSAYKGLYEGLAWVYKDWYISELKMREYSVGDYVNHYQMFSRKINYNIKPRLKHLVGFSWFVNEKLNDLNAAITAVKAGIYFYPDSSELKERLVELTKVKKQ